MNDKVCWQCRSTVHPLAKVCPHCGAKLGSAAAGGVAKKPMGWIMAIAIVGGGTYLILNTAASIGNSVEGSHLPPAPSGTTKASQAPPPPEKEEVKSIKLKQGIIKQGMTSDAFVEIVNRTNRLSQRVEKDGENPRSLLVYETWKVEGQTFDTIFGRVRDPGPYILIRIER